MTLKAEQLAVVVAQMEQNFSEHREIKDTLTKINDKLDKAIEYKADKSEVKLSNERIDKINEGLLTASRNATFQTVGLVLSALGVLVAIILAVKK